MKIFRQNKNKRKTKQKLRKIKCRFNDDEAISSLPILRFNKTVIKYDLDNQMPIKQRKTPLDRNAKEKKDKYEYKKNYKNMPEYKTKWVDAYHLCEFYFRNKTKEELSKIFQQKVTNNTKSLWFPKTDKYSKTNYAVLGGDSYTNQYPIYVVSKGRHNNCKTSYHLSLMEIKHYVVVEPQDVELYKQNLNLEYATILELDMQYKTDYDLINNDIGKHNGTGPGAARNFCWDHSINLGAEYHWVFDDNTTGGFILLYQNYKIKMRTGAFFYSVEEMVKKYKNIAIAGLNYDFFAPATSNLPPYVLNTRIYSYLLIRNDIPYRWRGRYNEDTDLSVRALKQNWCTIQFNSFLAGKANTQTVKGGNTDEFYDKEGTLNKSRMLFYAHPDITKLVWKFGRYHHYINYDIFKQKLQLNDDIDLNNYDAINNYDMKIIEIEPDDFDKQKSYLTDKYKDKLTNYVQPIFRKYE